MAWIDQKSIMNHEQTEDTKNNLDMKRDDRPDKTIASGIVTLQLRRAGPVHMYPPLSRAACISICQSLVDTPDGQEAGWRGQSIHARDRCDPEAGGHFRTHWLRR